MEEEREEVEKEFFLGVNYWPRRKAMYWWKYFEEKEVEEEFKVISEMGLKVVRIFLTWDDFQPTESQVSQHQLQNLKRVCEIANDLQLKLDITFFTGHMSGPNWLPRWLFDKNSPIQSPHVRQLIVPKSINFFLTNENDYPFSINEINEKIELFGYGEKVEKNNKKGGYRNMYTDPIAINSACLLVSKVVSFLADQTSIYCWNLGNEPDLFSILSSYSNRSEIILKWIKTMKTIIRYEELKFHKSKYENTKVNYRPITFGLHMCSLTEKENGFRVDEIFNELDFYVMHSYPMYTPWAKHPLDPDLVPFTCSLTRALHQSFLDSPNNNNNIDNLNDINENNNDYKIKVNVEEIYSKIEVEIGEVEEDPSIIQQKQRNKRVLMEEFGGCILPNNQLESENWNWTCYEENRKQFMASERDFKVYIEEVLPRLIEVGTIGAMFWCFADYDSALYELPPLFESKHERFFGLVRSDGSLKEHALYLKEFAATHPKALPLSEVKRNVKLDVTSHEYYSNPNDHIQQLYISYLKQ